MSVTRDGWEKVIVPIAIAVVLAPLGQYLLWLVRQPDVRYGTGGAYIHPTLALATVGLKNFGRSDAENVTITASFADPFTNVSTDRSETPFEPSAGATDQKSVMGTIKRLAPGEEVNIYFTIEPSEPWRDQTPVIRGLKFNGGLGKTGVPVLSWLWPLLAGGGLGGIAIAYDFLVGRPIRKASEEQICEVIQMGSSAPREGVSLEQLQAKVEAYRHQKIPWYRQPTKDRLLRYAQAAFTGARNASHPTDSR